MKLPQGFYEVGWAVWAVWFVVLEALAIVDRGTMNTLSEFLRAFLKLHPLCWFFGAALLSWLTWHLLSH